MDKKQILKCDICDTYNDQEFKFCYKCGHKFGIKDLDRELKYIELDVIERIKDKIVNWVNRSIVIVSLVIAFTGILGFSSLKQFYENNYKEVKESYENKLKELKGSYELLSKLNESINNDVGFKNNLDEKELLQVMLQSLILDFKLIRNIEVHTQYKFSKDSDLTNVNINPNFNQISLYKKESDYPNNSMIELVSLNNGNGIYLGDQLLHTKYEIVYPSKQSIKSTKDIFSLDQLNFIRFHSTSFHKTSSNMKKYMKERGKFKIEQINLDIYVNDLLFWKVKIDNPKIQTRIALNKATNGPIDYEYTTFIIDISNQLTKVKEVLSNRLKEANLM